MLSPYRVLDLTDANAQMGPMILADLGAEVIRIETPGASRGAAADEYAKNSPIKR